MKRIALTLLAAGALFTAQAQLFNPDSWNGALLGGIVGGIIGNNVHHQTWQGAAIGAGSGYVLGNIVHGARSTDNGPANANNYASYPGYGYYYPAYAYTSYYPARRVHVAPAQGYYVPDPQAANNTPQAPDNKPAYKTESPMSDANALFGR